MHDESHGAGAGESRREFLKKAGAVAWVVPTLQVVNMASAAAGDVAGSMVTTTHGTTPPPGCQVWVTCRIKANWTGNAWSWDSGVGANDCIQQGDWRQCLGSEIGAQISGDSGSATVTVGPECEILQAAHKGGLDCVSASIAGDKHSATFTAGAHGISHVELVVRCCAEEN